MVVWQHAAEFTSVTRYCGQLLLYLLLGIETNAALPDRRIFTFYGIWCLNEVFTGVCNWSLPWNKATPYSTILVTSFFILSSHRHTFNPKLSFLQVLCLFLISPVRATSLAHLIILIIFIEEHNLWSSSICSFLQPIINYLFLIYFLSVASSQTPSIDFIPWRFAFVKKSCLYKFRSKSLAHQFPLHHGFVIIVASRFSRHLLSDCHSSIHIFTTVTGLQLGISLSLQNMSCTALCPSWRIFVFCKGAEINLLRSVIVCIPFIHYY